MKTLTRSAPRPSRVVAAAALVSAAVLAVAGCSSSSSGGPAAAPARPSTWSAFSTPKPAYDALAAAFNEDSAGKGVKFSSSYGPSGSQAKAVAAGQKARLRRVLGRLGHAEARAEVRRRELGHAARPRASSPTRSW